MLRQAYETWIVYKGHVADNCCVNVDDNMLLMDDGERVMMMVVVAVGVKVGQLTVGVLQCHHLHLHHPNCRTLLR